MTDMKHYHMQLTIDISKKDMIEFGRESVQKEIENTLRWMRIRQSFGKISKELKSSFDEQHLAGTNLNLTII